ncbi:plasmid stabilization protein [Streptomyces sp. DSM 42041]|uniref:Plasmid stabilization protein n=1 Tax=Streptomyces hazeniae TaxID=3075538 RepID=A0ABU2NX35_9ACTN|nr:plasmid stabilization protein [Streptomyces sp. DSM 42041]MDT0381556.1 plasmid stabilization protein [Streptomyces sp. DSM 42041]
MPSGSSRRRERQYEHIKEGAEKRGTSEKRAKEIAARTVNKERARSGEAEQKSRVSTQDRLSAPERGGKRSGRRQGPGDFTKEQLYEEAKRRNVEGRSSMNKQELKQALGR